MSASPQTQFPSAERPPQTTLADCRAVLIPVSAGWLLSNRNVGHASASSVRADIYDRSAGPAADTGPAINSRWEPLTVHAPVACRGIADRKAAETAAPDSISIRQPVLPAVPAAAPVRVKAHSSRAKCRGGFLFAAGWERPNAPLRRLPGQPRGHSWLTGARSGCGSIPTLLARTSWSKSQNGWAFQQ